MPTGDRPAAPDLLEGAARLLRRHPSVESVSGPRAVGGGTALDLGIRVGLPIAWSAAGRSPKGVLAVETVRLTFPPTYPLEAPLVELRSDFDCSLAHVRPGPSGALPQPCIIDGDLSEFLQQQGLAGIVNQVVEWLENAALGTLINPSQGWEPIRRDSLDDIIAADASRIRTLVGRKAGFALFQLDFVYASRADPQRSTYYGEVGTDSIPLSPRNVGQILQCLASHTGHQRGVSVALVAWPGNLPDGRPMVAAEYRPETVTTWDGLLARAQEFGCLPPLRDGMGQISNSFDALRSDGTIPIVVMLCARRPYALIGSDSEIEICPYLIEAGLPDPLPQGGLTPVRMAGHHHLISVPLLRGMSGDDDKGRPRWTLLGCGSLGSKIGIHLARAGRAPSITIDKGTMFPRNAARHALLPAGSKLLLAWLGSKAAAMADACEGLAQPAGAMDQDFVTIARDPTLVRKAFPKATWAVVNATASLAVREALSSMAERTTRPRVIEASLFSDGEVALVTVEGPDLNPSTGDMIAEAYNVLRQDPHKRQLVFTGGKPLVRRTIGEGCGSATMAISDARISMAAAPVAEFLAALQRDGLPSGGRILVGSVCEDGLGMTWASYSIRPVTATTTDALTGVAPCRVRLSAAARGDIEAEVARWPGVETGGILLGRFSEASRTFHVIGVMDAPADSVRSPGEFVLGTKGVRSRLQEYGDSCGHALYCLGTWHSHLFPSGPSPLDRATARTVGLARLAPSVLLIRTPAGFRALLAAQDGRVAT